MSESATAVTNTGVPGMQEFTILQATLGDLTHYELCHGGDVLWSGAGNARVDGLLQIILRVTAGEDRSTPTTNVAQLKSADL
jgi:hypothetical protein